MSYTFTKLPQSQVELRITVAPSDYQADLEAAARRLSERAAIKGFRPGKAPYDIVKQQLGEVKIMEEALERIVQKTFFAAVKTEGLNTIGMPQISVAKLAPGNDLVYKATMALLPEVTLPNFADIKIEKKSVSVGETEVMGALENLKKMQPKEIIKPGPATSADKAIVALEMFIDKVPVEGGQAPHHQVYLSEPHYILGFAEQIVGLKAGDTKEFTLAFPAGHYQKHLAGKPVDFKIKVNEVFELQYPELDDEFAKSLGQESLQKLKDRLLANLTREAEKKEDERLEIALLEAVIAQTKFGELPQILVDSEKRKMFYELKSDLERRGIAMEKYLADIKKTEEQISNEFSEGATKRAQAALVSRQIAKENDITVEKNELDKEIELIKQTYKDDVKITENLKRPAALDAIAATVQNRKVVEWLKQKIVNEKLL